MYDGFLRLAGNEIINAQRTFQYVRNNLPGFPLKNCVPCPDLARVLGQPRYESPLVDDAPWMDESEPSLQGFFGAYPLAFEGTMDDTSEATTIEGLLDGGYTGGSRAASREMRVRALLIADDDLSLNAGMAWLKAALHPPPCDEHGGSCAGAQACMYAACPEIKDCYSDIPTDQPDVGFNTVTPNSPFRRTISHPGLTAAWIEIPVTGGFAFQWHATDPRDGRIIESRGPVVSRRRNFLWNPSFTDDISNGWTGTITRVDTGGVDDGPFVEIGDGELRSRDTQTMFGPIVASFAMQAPSGGASVLAEIVDAASGTTLVSQTFDPPLGWDRFSITTPNGRDVFLRFTTTGNVQFDQMMIETGTSIWPYFDGTYAPFDPLGGNLADQYTVDWEGDPQLSASSQIWTRGLLTGTQIQILRLEEVCIPEWQITLEAVAGSLANGTLHTSTREARTGDEQAIPYERYFHDVVTTSGPTVISEYAFESGAAVEVEWVMVAGTPFAFGATSDLLSRVNMAALPYADWTDVSCEMPSDSPLLDPDCPPLPSAPRPPAVPNLCIDDITSWKRVSVVVPGERISGWNQMLPTILLTTKSTEVRQVRVRFTPNPFNWPVTGASSRTNRANNSAGIVGLSGYTGLGSGTVLSASDIVGNASLPFGLRTYISVDQTTASLPAGAFGVESGASGQNLVTPGKYITVSQYANGTGGVFDVRMRLQFVDGAGAAVGSPILSSITSVNALDFHRIIGMNGILVPATAARVKVAIISVSPTTATAMMGVTGLLIEQFDTAHATPDVYFDGDFPDGDGVNYSWTSGRGTSTSTAFYSPIDPCSYCSEFILSYLPADSELTVDVLTRSAFASISDGTVKPASHLLYGTGGTPMTWPSLSCGISYVMTVDIPSTESVDNIDISLSLTKQE